MTGAIAHRDMEAQILDQMDLERERGITIKLQAVRLNYKSQRRRGIHLESDRYPGHVELYLWSFPQPCRLWRGTARRWRGSGHRGPDLSQCLFGGGKWFELIPSSIKSTFQRRSRCGKKIEEVLGIDASEALLVSAKTGQGVDEVLEAIVNLIPPPQGDRDGDLQALIFDSHFDSYKGAIPYVRVMNGSVSKGSKVLMMGTGKEFDITEVGVFTPALKLWTNFQAGDVGYLAASIKHVKDTQVGDTVTNTEHPALNPLPGYRQAMPMVYCGIYPVKTTTMIIWRTPWKTGIEWCGPRLRTGRLLQPWGFGFRCGFRTSSIWKIIQGTSGTRIQPRPTYHSTQRGLYRLRHWRQYSTRGESQFHAGGTENRAYGRALCQGDHHAPKLYRRDHGNDQDRRGIFKIWNIFLQRGWCSPMKCPCRSDLWLLRSAEITNPGVCSLDYELAGYRASNLVRLDILVSGDVVDTLSAIVHKDNAYHRSRQHGKTAETHPRQLFGSDDSGGCA